MDEATELELRLEALDSTEGKPSTEYSKLLNDLASLKLAQGKTEEAQHLFQQLVGLRQPQLSLHASEAQADAAHAGPHECQLNQGASAATPTAEDDPDDWESAPYVPPPLRSTAATSQTSGEQRSSREDLDWGPRAKHDDSVPAVTVAPAKSRATRRAQPEADEDAEAISGPVWEGGFNHCVEVFDLQSTVKTSHLQDLLDVVLPDVKHQPWIRWVDDNHAVFVCGNTTDAQRLLDCGEEAVYRMRPFSEATQASKQLPVSELLPPKARPKTTATVARKLLSHALGLPGLRDRPGEQQLAQARRDAKQERSARREAAASAWGDSD